MKDGASTACDIQGSMELGKMKNINLVISSEIEGLRKRDKLQWERNRERWICI